MTHPEPVPPDRFWENAKPAVRRMIPQFLARRKGIEVVDRELTYDVLMELNEDRAKVANWSELADEFLGTDRNAELRARIRRAIERVLDRRRPGRRPPDVRKGVPLNFDPPAPAPIDDGSVEWLMNVLTKSQRSIVGRVVFGKQSFRRAAKDLGVSEALAREIYSDAVRKIKGML